MHNAITSRSAIERAAASAATQGKDLHNELEGARAIPVPPAGTRVHGGRAACSER